MFKRIKTYIFFSHDAKASVLAFHRFLEFVVCCDQLRTSLSVYMRDVFRRCTAKHQTVSVRLLASLCLHCPLLWVYPSYFWNFFTMLTCAYWPKNGIQLLKAKKRSNVGTTSNKAKQGDGWSLRLVSYFARKPRNAPVRFLISSVWMNFTFVIQVWHFEVYSFLR